MIVSVDISRLDRAVCWFDSHVLDISMKSWIFFNVALGAAQVVILQKMLLIPIGESAVTVSCCPLTTANQIFI